jgi:hypothetical protein
MNRLLKGFLVIAGLLVSTGLMAHPGHGTFTGNEIWHYITSPLHIGIVLAIVVVAIVLLVRKKHTKDA